MQIERKKLKMIDGLKITEALLNASNRDKLAIRCRLNHCNRVASKAKDILLLEIKNDMQWDQNDIELFTNAAKMHDCVKYLVTTKEHGEPASELFDAIYSNENCTHFGEIKLAVKSHSRKELAGAFSGDEFIPLRCLCLADVLDKIAVESILYSDVGLTGNPKEISQYILKVREKIYDYWDKSKNTFKSKKNVSEYINREVSFRLKDYSTIILA